MSAGIPLEATDFFAELEGNNERTWWLANQDRWRRDVREPMQRLCDGLEPDFGAAKLFRPQRDVRFSQDKSPYKIHQGAVVTTSDGVGYYVQVSSDGLLTGAGWYLPDPVRIAAYREAVLDDDTGGRLESIVAALDARGVEVGGDRLKTAPRGIDPGHPRIALLRHRTVLASLSHGTPAWLETDEVVERVAADWRACRPLMDWLDANIHP